MTTLHQAAKILDTIQPAPATAAASAGRSAVRATLDVLAAWMAQASREERITWLTGQIAAIDDEKQRAYFTDWRDYLSVADALGEWGVAGGKRVMARSAILRRRFWYSWDGSGLPPELR